MSPGHAHLARGRAVLDSYQWLSWNLEGAAASYRGQFDARHENSLLIGGMGPEASATLIVSASAVEASGITLGKRVVVQGRTYVVTGHSPQPFATDFYLSDPNT